MHPPGRRNRSLVLGDESFPLETPLREGYITGYSFFCPTCGNIWAKLEVADGEQWFSFSQPCEAHGNGYTTGGSIIRPLLWQGSPTATKLPLSEVLLSLPPSLRQREALLRAEQILKG